MAGPKLDLSYLAGKESLTTPTKDKEEPTQLLKIKGFGTAGNVRVPVPKTEMRPTEVEATRLAPDITTPQTNTGLLDRTLGATFVGMSKNPILSTAIRATLKGNLFANVPGIGALGLSPGGDERVKAYESAVERVAQRIENSPNQDFVRVSELVGEYGLELGMGGGALIGGKKLAVRGLQEVAPKLAGRGPVGKEMARVAFKTVEEAGELYPRMVPKLQQATEILGEAAGLSGYTSISDYLENGDITHSTRDAAYTFALTALFGTGLRMFGKAFAKGREINAMEVEAGTRTPEFKAMSEAGEAFYQKRIEKTVAAMNKVLKVDEHTAAAKAFEKAPTLPGIVAGKPSRIGRKPVTSQKVLDKVINQTEGQPNVRALNLKIKGESNYYREETVPISKLKLSGEDMKGVSPSRAARDKGPIVIDRAGNVIDGRHRVALAQQEGEKVISAYKPFSPKAPTYQRVFSDQQITRAHRLRTSLRQSRAAKRALHRVTTTQPIPTNYMKGPRVAPGTNWEIIQRLIQYAGKTPEAFFGQFGKTFAQFGEAWSRAETYSAINRGTAEAFIHNLQYEAGAAMGFKGVRKNGKWMLPIVHAYEKEGLVGVRQFMRSPLGNAKGEEKMVKVFQQVEHELGAYRELEQMGAEPWMGRKKLAEYGNKNYWPHVMRNLSDEELKAKLVRGYMEEAAENGVKLTQEQAQLKASEALATGPSFGLARSGTIDHTRLFKGSLQEKVQKGRPFEDDPLKGLFAHIDNVGRRTAFGREFGFKGEIGEKLINLVEVETDARTASLARTFVDHAINRKFEDRLMVEFADRVTSLQIASKLPLSVIANITQTSVTATIAGFNNALRGSVRGVGAIVKGEVTDDVLRGVGLADSMMGVMGDAFFEGVPRTRLTNLARWVLKYTGFDAAERFNRITAGAATLYDIRTTMMQAWEGRLKGATLDAARRRMGAYGLNLGEMVQKGKAVGDINGMIQPAELEYAIFRGAQQSQFIPSPVRKPLPWQNRGFGRVITQFKTFGLGYGRFVKDRVFAELGRGNYKPLITFLGVTQPAGEFVADMQEATKLRDPLRSEMSPLERLADNQLSVGGIGLVTSSYVSAKWGKGLESAAGPTVGWSFNMLGDLVTGRFNSALHTISREPSVVLTRDIVLGTFISGKLIKDFFDNEDTKSSKPQNRRRGPVINIEELIEKE